MFYRKLFSFAILLVGLWLVVWFQVKAKIRLGKAGACYSSRECAREGHHGGEIH